MQPSYTAPSQPNSYKRPEARAPAAQAIGLRPEVCRLTTGARMRLTSSTQSIVPPNTDTTFQHTKSSKVSLAVAVK